MVNALRLLSKFLVVIISIIFFSSIVIADNPEALPTAISDNTVFAVFPDSVEKKNVAVDLTQKYKVAVNGGSIVDDEVMGSCILLEGEKSAIKVNYTGDKEVFKGRGFTIEAWIKPDKETVLNKSTFMLKGKTAYLGFKKENLNVGWLNLPTNKIFVEENMKGKRLDYFPLAKGYNGTTPLKRSAWNHIAFTYDEKMKLMRTWINGGLDREVEILRDGQQWIECKRGRFYFFTKMKRCKIAGIKLSIGAKKLGCTPPMKHYLNQLPWQNKMVLTLDKISPELPLPIELLVKLEGVKGGIYRKEFNSYDTAHFEIPMPRMWKFTRPLFFHVYAAGKEIYSGKEWYYNGKPDRKSSNSVHINPDKSISKNGKKIFPLFMYHVLAEDVSKVKKMGFNIVSGKSLELPWCALPPREIEKCSKFMESAVAEEMNFSWGVNFFDSNVSEYVNKYKKIPGMLFWYCADEPWRNWDRLRINYNYVRTIDSNRPVITVQCNDIHMKNTGPTCDIVGCDPYPIPGVSMRGVAKLTIAAKKASFGYKPVITILPAYGPKIPTYEELRCMAYIAICSGANGLGIYAWDDRLKKKNGIKGYYMGEHPEVVSLVSKVILEIKGLESVLVTPNVESAISVDKSQPAIHASIKEANGKTYLFLVNDSRQAKTGGITISKKYSGTWVPVKAVGKSENLTFENNTARVTLPAMAAIIYKMEK